MSEAGPLLTCLALALIFLPPDVKEPSTGDVSVHITRCSAISCCILPKPPATRPTLWQEAM